ncbi:hypothetical protein MUP01_03855 [Candidatus Bathyarchaeota archaeon]|nr:hypothetical protein [Candidatus Bathyarchaeota archaeon]
MTESIIHDKWFWFTILSVIIIIVLPLIIVLFLIQLPDELKLVSMIALIVIWGVVSGYKDWVIARRKET